MPKIGGDHKKLHGYFQEVIDSGHFTEGKFVRRFEDMVSEFYGHPAVAVNSCGSGLFALGRVFDMRGMPEGWLAPNNTFIATVSMIREALGLPEDDGMLPYLLDCNKQDFSIELADLRGATSEYEFDWLVYTHVGGMISSEFAGIVEECNQHEIRIIEDRAHAFGIREPLAGEAAVFSLYPTKSIPVGDGGVVILQDENKAEELRRFRTYGKSLDDTGTVCYAPSGGFNLRMDEWTAAVAVYQMERLSEIMEKREAAAAKLMQVVQPIYMPPEDKRNWYKYIVPADFKAVQRTGKVYALTDQVQTIMPEVADGIGDVFENCAWVAENHICLPIDEDMYVGMTAGEIEAWLLGKQKS